jgi:hypothetical protein
MRRMRVRARKGVSGGGAGNKDVKVLIASLIGSRHYRFPKIKEAAVKERRVKPSSIGSAEGGTENSLRVGKGGTIG